MQQAGREADEEDVVPYTLYGSLGSEVSVILKVTFAASAMASFREAVKNLTTFRKGDADEETDLLRSRKADHTE